MEKQLDMIEDGTSSKKECLDQYVTTIEENVKKTNAYFQTNKSEITTRRKNNAFHIHDDDGNKLSIKHGKFGYYLG